MRVNPWTGEPVSRRGAKFAKVAKKRKSLAVAALNAFGLGASWFDFLTPFLPCGEGGVLRRFFQPEHGG